MTIVEFMDEQSRPILLNPAKAVAVRAIDPVPYRIPGYYTGPRSAIHIDGGDQFFVQGSVEEVSAKLWNLPAADALVAMKQA